MSKKLKQLKEKLRQAIRKELVEYDNLNTRKEKELEERINLFVEKNTPTNPSKWSYYKSQAKKKFDVYPSAYADAWAAKKYKAAGGGWKKEQIGEASMTGNLDGGEGPPKTPYAFQSKKKRGQDKKKEDEIATNSTGFVKMNENKLNEVVGKEVDAVNKVLKKLKILRQDYIKIMKIGDKTLSRRNYNKYYESILNAEQEITKLHQTLKGHLIAGINEGKYHQWRNDESLSPKQKIGRSMREVRDSLNGLSKTIDMSVRLKNELKVDTTDYWKTSHKALGKISERLVKLANKVGKLQ